MKNLILSMCMVALSTNLVSQVDTLYASPKHNHTVVVWDVPDIVESKAIDYIKHEDGVSVLINKVYGDAVQYYMLSDSSGFVSLNNQFSNEKPNYNYRPNTKEYLGWVTIPTEPCATAEYYRQKYISTGSIIDMDNYRKWLSECMDKEY